MVGVKVVDFSRVLAGPWAGQHLADQGAEVIKVEPPGGDETRRFGPIVSGVSTYYLSCNRNKRSIVLDLRTDAGREVALRLVAGADAVLHNWRPGVDARLGLDWERLRAIAPNLVYVAISGFGSDSPPAWRARAGYDLVLQAMGGAMSFTGFPGQPPIRAGAPVADLVAGLLAVQAVLYGLLQVARGGAGQRIEVNMLQAQSACLVYHATRQDLTGESEAQRGNAHAGLAPYDVYPCADGWLAVAVGNDTLWSALVAALGLDDRPEWQTNLDRVAARADVDAAIRSALADRSAADAESALAAAGVPAGRVLDVEAVMHHEAVTRAVFDHPAVGAVHAAGPVLRTATTRTSHRAPPGPGDDRDAILTEVGYDGPAIRDLADRGAFGGRN